MTTGPKKTLGEWIAEIEPHMVPVAHESSEIACSICHGFRDGPQAVCSSCRLTIGQVTRPLEKVVPITTTTRYTQMYHILRNYKSEYTADSERRLMQVRMSAALTHFLRRHGACIGAWDHLVVVPSTRREPPHAMERVITRSPRLNDSLRSPLEVTGTPPGKRQARDTCYRTTSPVQSDRILLIDDTFTSGASLQSAASRLALDGAEVVGAVVFGRFVNREWGDNQQHLEGLEEEDFDWSRCCIH